MGQAHNRGQQYEEKPGAGTWQRWLTQGQVLTHRPQRGAPEELVESGQVHGHAEFVWPLG